MNEDQKASTPPQPEFNEHERLAGLIHAFIGMMQAGNMSRLDLEYRDLRLSLRSNDGAGAATIVPRMVAQQTQVVVGSSTEDGIGDGHVITAPMIGTFYVAAAPGEAPFVQVGDRVDEGQTIGIIEAMKIMNEIAADRSGTVTDIIAENAQTVEYGSPLIKIDPDVA